jgi:alpha-L-fucosidase
MKLTRRTLLNGIIGTTLAGAAPMQALAQIAALQPVTPTWAGLANTYQYPDWFRDAKFGIWSHWGPQCVPEFGDWYARLMYIQGTASYKHHLKHYGHPSSTGFLNIINQWKAQNWDAVYLTRLYKKAGAKYIVSMANHVDNLDMFNSDHHGWNTLNVGPKRDIVGTWEKAVRAEGLRFGVSNHSGHAWHWNQAAYTYDVEGPMKGKRYDAYTLTQADGAGTWWEGLDPQELYTGRHMVMPDGIDNIKAMKKWHRENDDRWMEHGPDDGGKYVAKWLARQKDLVEKYRPDLVYLDNYGLPFGDAGLKAAAHYYTQAIGWSGTTGVAMTAKELNSDQRLGVMEDVERGFIDHIADKPWQTCTCIGSWHYDRRHYENKTYKSAQWVIQRLMDAVSKNGNLLLSVPMRADGSIDSEEEKVLTDITDWIGRNGDAVYGTRPWRMYGHGPTELKTGTKGERTSSAFTGHDVRYVQRNNSLFAAMLDWPNEPVRLAPLGKSAMPAAQIEKISLMDGTPVSFEQAEDALMINLPEQKGAVPVPVVQIQGRGIA